MLCCQRSNRNLVLTIRYPSQQELLPWTLASDAPSASPLDRHWQSYQPDHQAPLLAPSHCKRLYSFIASEQQNFRDQALNPTEAGLYVAPRRLTPGSHACPRDSKHTLSALGIPRMFVKMQTPAPRLGNSERGLQTTVPESSFLTCVYQGGFHITSDT